MARLKKPPVPEERAQDWFDRKRRGETPPQIAEKDSYDVRTVRKYLRLYEKKAEAAQARTAVYRDAMQKHFEDFTDLAKRLESRLAAGEATVDLESSSPVYGALKDHLAQSTLWKRLDEWNRLLQAEAQSKADLETAIKNLNKNDAALAAACQGGQVDLDGINSFIACQLNWILGSGELRFDVDRDLGFAPSQIPGLVDAKCGAYILGRVEGGKKSDLKVALKGVQSNLAQIAELQALIETKARKSKMVPVIREQLNVIIWKRVVPGHCRYCPI